MRTVLDAQKELFGRNNDLGVSINKLLKERKERVIGFEEVKLRISLLTRGQSGKESSTVSGHEHRGELDNFNIGSREHGRSTHRVGIRRRGFGGD